MKVKLLGEIISKITRKIINKIHKITNGAIIKVFILNYRLTLKVGIMGK